MRQGDPRKEVQVLQCVVTQQVCGVRLRSLALGEANARAVLKGEKAVVGGVGESSSRAAWCREV